MKMKNKEKQTYVDDGHTIYSMDVEGLKNRRQKHNRSTLNNKERFALIKAAFARYLPILFGMILCFGIAMVLIYFWLN